MVDLKTSPCQGNDDCRARVLEHQQPCCNCGLRACDQHQRIIGARVWCDICRQVPDLTDAEEQDAISVVEYQSEVERLRVLADAGLSASEARAFISMTSMVS